MHSADGHLWALCPRPTGLCPSLHRAVPAAAYSPRPLRRDAGRQRGVKRRIRASRRSRCERIPDRLSSHTHPHTHSASTYHHNDCLDQVSRSCLVTHTQTLSLSLCSPFPHRSSFCLSTSRCLRSFSFVFCLFFFFSLFTPPPPPTLTSVQLLHHYREVFKLNTGATIPAIGLGESWSLVLHLLSTLSCVPHIFPVSSAALPCP